MFINFNIKRQFSVSDRRGIRLIVKYDVSTCIIFCVVRIIWSWTVYIVDHSHTFVYAIDRYFPVTDVPKQQAHHVHV